MKIGLDIHGVINKRPEFFKKFASIIIQSGGEVHILSGPPLNVIEKELKGYGIERVVYQREDYSPITTVRLKKTGHYTHLFSIVDYHKEIGTPMTEDVKGHCYLSGKDSDYLWNKTKADYCEKNKIDLMIDDSEFYGDFFTTPYSKFSANPSELRKRILTGESK